MIIQRELFTQIEPYFKSPEAIVVTGMRRTGKTTLLKYIYDKITSTNKLYLDLENPLNQKLFEEKDFEKIKFNMEIKGLNFNEKAYIFLDEIQLFKKLPQIVKYLYDHYKIKFFLTGSSSFYLKNIFSESLAGRKYIFELFPLSFKEFLLIKGKDLKIPSNEKISNNLLSLYATLYEEYLKFGGFPGVVLKTDFAEKKMALEEIFTSYFQLEVKELGDFKKTTVIRDLILLLMQRIGSKLDIQRIASELNISRPTIYEYLAFLEGTYFIKLIKPYSQNKDIEIRGAEKVYVCDSGLANNLVNVSEGCLFENNIFQLLRPKGKINYFQKRNGHEVDFILNGKVVYEVKLHPTKSDFNKLKEMSKELKIKDFWLISKTYSDVENVKYWMSL